MLPRCLTQGTWAFAVHVSEVRSAGNTKEVSGDGDVMSPKQFHFAGIVFCVPLEYTTEICLNTEA